MILPNYDHIKTNLVNCSICGSETVTSFPEGCELYETCESCEASMLETPLTEIWGDCYAS